MHFVLKSYRNISDIYFNFINNQGYIIMVAIRTGTLNVDILGYINSLMMGKEHSIFITSIT